MSETEATERSPVRDGRPFIIGLTGPIGCGKSTVAAMLGRLGGVVIDADALTREVMAPGQPALEAIRARFGDAVFSDADAGAKHVSMADQKMVV